jgi:hypothetical protein
MELIKNSFAKQLPGQSDLAIGKTGSRLSSDGKRVIGGL